MLTTSMLIVLGVLAAAALLFLTEWLPVDLVAILVLLVLALTGVISYADALAGFSNTAVITIAAVLVLGAGLMRTGVANIVGRHVLKLAGSSEVRLLVITMVTVGLLSGFMNNIGVAALFLPVVLEMSRRLNRAPSKLLMPLAFGSLLGGLTTLIGTTPNILISGALASAGHEEFGLLDFTPIGIASITFGTLYMAVIGRRLLPDRDMAKEGQTPERRLDEAYGLSKRLCAMSIPGESALSGKTLAESRLGSALGLNVVAITRDGNTSLAPGADSVLQAGDRLLVEGRLDRLNQMRGWRHLVLDSEAWTRDRLADVTIDLAACTLEEGSPLCGDSLLSSGFRRRYGVNVLSVARGSEVLLSGLAVTELRAGDRLLLQGIAGKLRRLEQHPDVFSDLTTIPADRACDEFHFHERLMAVRVPEASVLAGKMLAESRLGNAFDLTVLGMLHEGRRQLSPDPGEEFQPGDLLLVQGLPGDLMTLQGLQELRIHESMETALPEIETDDIGLLEVMLAPGSRLGGKSPREMRFRERNGLTVVAIWSEGHAYRSNLRDRPIGMGDVMLVHGPRDRLQLLSEDREFLPLTTEAAADRVDESRAPLGIAIMSGVVLSVLVGWLPIYIAAPVGVAAMVLTGCIAMEDVYGYIEWKALVLIAGMLTLGVAMEQTGTAALLAEVVLGNVAQFGSMAVLAALFWLTALAAQVMPTAAVAVLISPIAINASRELAMDPHTLLMVVAVAASSAFMSPVGHPVNLMVMGLGGYRFADYTRVGAGLVLIHFVIALVLVPLLFPLSG
jgi:di/tricarboxylate transporter